MTFCLQSRAVLRNDFAIYWKTINCRKSHLSVINRSVAYFFQLWERLPSMSCQSFRGVCLEPSPFDHDFGTGGHTQDHLFGCCTYHWRRDEWEPQFTMEILEVPSSSTTKHGRYSGVGLLHGNMASKLKLVFQKKFHIDAAFHEYQNRVASIKMQNLLKGIFWNRAYGSFKFIF